MFIPFFLISVGMLVDLRVIMNGTGALIVAGTLSVVALFGKWFAALFTQLIFRYSATQRQLIFGMSSAHAAATLAIILVGYNAKILDENILNGTIILILITCVIASFATEKAARKIILESEDGHHHPEISNGFNNEHILLPIANIDNIEKLLEFSILIKDKKSINPVSVLSVVSNNTEAEKNILIARNKLEEFVRQASASENKVNIITTIDHNAASGIVRISREILADTIVLGWPHRTGLFDKLIGDRVDNILSNADKTTFICHLEKTLVLHRKILIFVPPFAEHENGFEMWLSKMAKLAQELSIPIIIHCNSSTEKAVTDFVKSGRSTASISTESFDNWDNFQAISGKDE